jgi:glycerol transport system permease protein
MSGRKTNVAGLIILVIYVLFTLFPIYWMVNSAFKRNTEIMRRLTFLPDHLSLGNFQRAFGNAQWTRALSNSLMISVGCVALCLLVGIWAAYAFSRHRFIGDRHFFFWLITNRMAPAAVFVTPYFMMYTTTGLYDTIPGIILAHTLFNLPLTIWLLVSFMNAVPRDLDEAAFVDGYSFVRYFRRIFIPVIAPGIGVTAFFLFIFSWSELLLGSVLTAASAKPVTVALLQNVSMFGVDWGLVAAISSLAIVPGVVFAVFVRKYIARGFLVG